VYADCVRGRVLSVVRVFGSSCFVLGANSNSRRGRAGSRLLACRIVCGALPARNVTRSCSLTSPRVLYRRQTDTEALEAVKQQWVHAGKPNVAKWEYVSRYCTQTITAPR
jgi:hypothetical protein